MVSQLRDSNNDLPTVDYGDLLKKIIETLQASSEPVFKIMATVVDNKSYKRCIFNIDQIATTVSQKPILDPLSRSPNHKTTTLNFTEQCEKQFPQKIQQVQQILEKLLQYAVNHHLQAQPSISPQTFIKQLIVDLSSFEGKQATANFSYPFSEPNSLKKCRLTFDDVQSKDKHLRFHKLTIRVNHGINFDELVKAGILNYLDQEFENCSVENKEELEDIVDDLYRQREEPKNDFGKLKTIVNQETLGKLKRKAQIIYLQFLLDQYHQSSKEIEEEGAIYLQSLIRRLQYIDEYINLDYADGDYEIQHSNGSINYRDIFAREDAFDDLPVIPIISGNLGEFRLDGAIEFTLGLKLKLNGDVNTSKGESSFQYHLDLLNPDSKLHQENISTKFGFLKILKIALLYFFVFACDDPNSPNYQPTDDLNYNPIEKFQSNVLPDLQKSDDSRSDMLREIHQDFMQYEVEKKIDKLVKFLKKVINYKTPANPQEIPVYLTLKNRLFKDNYQKIIDESTVFDQCVTGNPKLALKYIDVTEARSQSNTFLNIPVTLGISDLQYFITDDEQSFRMQYDIRSVKVLPIIFGVKDNSSLQKFYAKYELNQCNALVFPHQQAKPSLKENFFYNFTFSLLVYTTLNILLKKERLFLPILRLDIEKGDNAGLRESFMYNFSKVLAHLLNEQHRSNAQGIDVRSANGHKIKNAMSSLYSVLPKIFTLPQPTKLDKLAMIIVSSRNHDRSWKREIQQKYETLMGEVVGILQEEHHKVKYRLIQTFSANYDRETLFTQPTIMGDVIQKLYCQGYRHIIYIAKAPYTSTLHLTQNQDDEDLFFMSRNIMRLLKGEYQDLNIYPMFFDKYYVVPLKTLAQSLYIEDTAELTHLAEDQNKRFAVFFNLFNGQAVGNDRTYRGVISYSTLLNFYDGILGDQKIRQGLIDQGNLKQDILQYLTLFHFARYEKMGKNIQLKLDPYQNLIGEKSVSKLALMPHAKERVEFNVLAFLTRVKVILNKK